MFKPNSQLKDIFKISLNIRYNNIDIFEEFFAEKVSATSMYEVKSKTIEPQPDDIWCFEVYYNNKIDFTSIKNEIQKFAEFNNLKIIGDIVEEEIENKDWVTLYQNQLSPIQTEQFFICTKLHQDKCSKDKTLILIEASRAFGTGSHETTFGCIEALEYLAGIKIDKILDIGTGSGILSFVAEKLWSKAEIFACDIDKTAIENAEFNNSFVKFYQNTSEEILLDSYHSIASSVKFGYKEQGAKSIYNKRANGDDVGKFKSIDYNKFDLIISNILALPLIELSTQIKKLINENGYLILSGFLDYQMEEVKNAYEKVGFKVKKTIYKNSWIILIATYGK